MSWDHYTTDQMQGPYIGNCATIIGWDEEVVFSSTGVEVMTQEQAGVIVKRMKAKNIDEFKQEHFPYGNYQFEVGNWNFDANDTFMEGVGNDDCPLRGFHAIKTNKLLLVTVWDKRYDMTRDRNYEAIREMANYFIKEGW